jgi:hypothetical protein
VTTSRSAPSVPSGPHAAPEERAARETVLSPADTSTARNPGLTPGPAALQPQRRPTAHPHGAHPGGPNSPALAPLRETTPSPDDDQHDRRRANSRQNRLHQRLMGAQPRLGVIKLHRGMLRIGDRRFHGQMVNHLSQPYADVVATLTSQRGRRGAVSQHSTMIIANLRGLPYPEWRKPSARCNRFRAGQSQPGVRGGRLAMKSLGKPSLRRDVQRAFWHEMAKGITSEDAAVAVGVSQAAGRRWFRHRGGIPTFMTVPIAGRYLSFSEREEIALLNVHGAGVRESARRVGRGPSTISWELRRNAATRKSPRSTSLLMNGSSCTSTRRWCPKDRPLTPSGPSRRAEVRRHADATPLSRNPLTGATRSHDAQRIPR